MSFEVALLFGTIRADSTGEGSQVATLIALMLYQVEFVVVDLAAEKAPVLHQSIFIL